MDSASQKLVHMQRLHCNRGNSIRQEGRNCTAVATSLGRESAFVAGGFDFCGVESWYWPLADPARRVACIEECCSEVHCLAVGASSSEDASMSFQAGHRDGTCSVWALDLSQEAVVSSYQWRSHSKAPVSSCTFSGVEAISVHGRYTATGGADSAAGLWTWSPDGTAVEGIRRMDGAHGGAVTAVKVQQLTKDQVPSDFQEHHVLCATAGEDNLVRLWCGSVDVVLPAHTREPATKAKRAEVPLCLALDAKNSRVASGSSDGFVRLWDTVALRPTRCYQHRCPPGERHINLEHRSLRHKGVQSVAFDSDIDVWRVANGNEDGTICLWDVRQAEVVHEFSAHTGAVTGLSVREELLLAAALDSTATLWDLRQMVAPVQKIAFQSVNGPEGRRQQEASCVGLDSLQPLPDPWLKQFKSDLDF